MQSAVKIRLLKGHFNYYYLADTVSELPYLSVVVSTNDSKVETHLYLSVSMCNAHVRRNYSNKAFNRLG